jgi:hypothetical protein
MSTVLSVTIFCLEPSTIPSLNIGLL